MGGDPLKVAQWVARHRPPGWTLPSDEMQARLGSTAAILGPQYEAVLLGDETARASWGLPGLYELDTASTAFSCSRVPNSSLVHVCVHLLDVTRLVPRGTPPDEEAAQRGCAVHAEEGTGQYPASLAPLVQLAVGLTSPTLSLSLYVDLEHASVRQLSLARTVVTPSCRLGGAALLYLAPALAASSQWAPDRVTPLRAPEGVSDAVCQCVASLGAVAAALQGSRQHRGEVLLEPHRGTEALPAAQLCPGPGGVAIRPPPPPEELAVHHVARELGIALGVWAAAVISSRSETGGMALALAGPSAEALARLSAASSTGPPAAHMAHSQGAQGMAHGPAAATQNPSYVETALRRLALGEGYGPGRGMRGGSRMPGAHEGGAWQEPVGRYQDRAAWDEGSIGEVPHRMPQRT